MSEKSRRSGSLFMYAVEGILAYSVMPLYMASALGVVMCLLSFIVLILIVVRALLLGDPKSIGF